MTNEDKEQLNRIEAQLNYVRSILDKFLPTIERLMKHPMLARFIAKR